MTAFDDYINNMDMQDMHIQHVLDKWNGRVYHVRMNRRVIIGMLIGLACGMVLRKIINRRR